MDNKFTAHISRSVDLLKKNKMDLNISHYGIEQTVSFFSPDEIKEAIELLKLAEKMLEKGE